MDNDLRINKGNERGEPFEIMVNGKPTSAYPGETIATVLLAAGYKLFHHSALSGEPRGMYCGMGLCYDCLVTVNGEKNIRACKTTAHPGDEVERQMR